MGFFMNKMFVCGIAALLLTACNEPPAGYVSTPAVAAFVEQELVSSKNAKVDTVAICGLPDEAQASILFDDSMIYTYNLNLKDKTVQLFNFSTKEQRAVTVYPDYGCIKRTKYQSNFAPYLPVGSYRFEVRYFSTKVYVPEDKVAFEPFDDKEKAVLKVGFVAVKAAILEHQKFAPVDKTWKVVNK